MLKLKKSTWCESFQWLDTLFVGPFHSMNGCSLIGKEEQWHKPIPLRWAGISNYFSPFEKVPINTPAKLQLFTIKDDSRENGRGFISDE